MNFKKRPLPQDTSETASTTPVSVKHIKLYERKMEELPIYFSECLEKSHVLDQLSRESKLFPRVTTEQLCRLFQREIPDTSFWSWFEPRYMVNIQPHQFYLRGTHEPSFMSSTSSSQPLLPQRGVLLSYKHFLENAEYVLSMYQTVQRYQTKTMSTNPQVIHDKPQKCGYCSQMLNMLVIQRGGLFVCAECWETNEMKPVVPGTAMQNERIWNRCERYFEEWKTNNQCLHWMGMQHKLKMLNTPWYEWIRQLVRVVIKENQGQVELQCMVQAAHEMFASRLVQDFLFQQVFLETQSQETRQLWWFLAIQLLLFDRIWDIAPRTDVRTTYNSYFQCPLIYMTHPSSSSSSSQIIQSFFAIDDDIALKDIGRVTPEIQKQKQQDVNGKDEKKQRKLNTDCIDLTLEEEQQQQQQQPSVSVSPKRQASLHSILPSTLGLLSSPTQTTTTTTAPAHPMQSSLTTAQFVQENFKDLSQFQRQFPSEQPQNSRPPQPLLFQGRGIGSKQDAQEAHLTQSQLTPSLSPVLVPGPNQTHLISTSVNVQHPRSHVYVPLPMNVVANPTHTEPKTHATDSSLKLSLSQRSSPVCASQQLGYYQCDETQPEPQHPHAHPDPPSLSLSSGSTTSIPRLSPMQPKIKPHSPIPIYSTPDSQRFNLPFPESPPPQTDFEPQHKGHSDSDNVL